MRPILRKFAVATNDNLSMMKKYVMDLRVAAATRQNDRYVLLKLTSENALPPMIPGKFAEVRVDGSPSTFLRRPVSIHFVD